MILKSYEVHVWLLFLSEERLGFFSKNNKPLSSEELTKAGKFRFRRDRERFVAAHSFLRVLLSSYLACDPASLEFSSNPYGKLFLVMKSISNPIYFNMSDSGDYVAYALNRVREIGIDIEKIRPDFATREVAERFFQIMKCTFFDPFQHPIEPKLCITDDAATGTMYISLSAAATRWTPAFWENFGASQ